MEWLAGGAKFLIVKSAAAWDLVVALVGGYLAAKGKEGLSQRQFAAYVAVAIISGFAMANFLVPFAVEHKYLSETAASNLRPLAILVSAATSLLLIDLIYSYIARAKKAKFNFRVPWAPK
jgi:hypothetical protein